MRPSPVIVSLLLVSLVLLSSTSRASEQGPAALTTYSSSDWLNWARTAWQYYEPGVGVNRASGLHRATLYWDCFTDWDLGTYLFSILFARKLNLIADGSRSGDWQFNDRIKKLLTFLQNRPMFGPMPYWAYDWATGAPCSNGRLTLSVKEDQGRLLGALHALVVFRPSYSSQVASILARSRSAYDALSTQLGTDYYSYLIAEGYATFGYNESAIFDAMNSYESGPSYSVYGQQLPQLSTLAEPFDLAILEGPMIGYAPSSAFLDFAHRDYLAQMGRWSGTGKLTAWSEGVYLPGINYVHEWVLETFTNPPETWIVRDEFGKVYFQPQYPPFVYAKVAFSFLAIYGANAYTEALVGSVLSLAGSDGFGEAVWENGTSAFNAFNSQGDGGGFYSDKTNEQVLAAAEYAISHVSPLTSSLPMSSAGINSSSLSTTEQSVGNSLSISLSSQNSTDIPGLLWGSVITGVMVGIWAMVMIRHKSPRARDWEDDSKA